MKKMNEVKARDFGKFHSEEWVTYKKATIRITFDYLNGRWYYGSETHSISGVFYGNFADLKKQIKSEYKKKAQKQCKTKGEVFPFIYILINCRKLQGRKEYD